MTTQKKFKILKPLYFDKFHCIGAHCEDNCCRRDWRIDVDKKLYDFFQKLHDNEWRKKFNKHLSINSSADASGEEYAKINLRDNCCPFLDTAGYCAIQTTLGEQYSPLVCRTYPRVYNVINGMLEKSLALSCPEAARIVLKNSDSIKFIEAEEDFYVFNILGKILDTTEVYSFHEPQRYFWELRIFIISLLQDKRYELWEKMIILGSFFDSLNNGEKTSVPVLIDNYTMRLDQGYFAAFLFGIPNQIITEVKIIKKLLVMPGRLEDFSFAECLAEALCGFGIKGKKMLDEADTSLLSLYYAKAYYDYYSPVFKEYTYMLENYMVNYVFMSLFPFDDDKNIFDNYVSLAVHYSLIKILLVGVAGFHKEKFNDSHIIKLLSSVAHAVEQNSIYLKKVFDFLNAEKMTDLRSIATLLKG